MGRRVLVAVLFAVSALAAATAVLTFASRPDLEESGERVEAAWDALRPALAARYDALAGAAEVAGERLGPDRPLLAEIRRAVDDWARSEGTGVEAQVAASNRLEGLATRLAVFVAATPRLRSSEEMGEALEALDDADASREPYNEAVAAYEALRGGFPRRLVAGALGFDARRTLEVPASPA